MAISDMRDNPKTLNRSGSQWCLLIFILIIYFADYRVHYMGIYFADYRVHYMGIYFAD